MPVCRHYCIAELWVTRALAPGVTPRMRSDRVNQREQEAITRKPRWPLLMQPMRQAQPHLE
jgi:hypothetical protein